MSLNDAPIGRPPVALSDAVSMEEITRHLQEQFGSYRMVDICCDVCKPPDYAMVEVVEPIILPDGFGIGYITIPPGRYLLGKFERQGSNSHWVECINEKGELGSIVVGYGAFMGATGNVIDWRGVRNAENKGGGTG